MAGSLKRESDDLSEDMVLMRALRDMNMPKFVFEDVPLFLGLINDLFPGLSCPRVGPLVRLVLSVHALGPLVRLMHALRFVSSYMYAAVYAVRPAEYTRGSTECYTAYTGIRLRPEEIYQSVYHQYLFQRGTYRNGFIFEYCVDCVNRPASHAALERLLSVHGKLTCDLGIGREARACWPIR